MDNQIEVTFSDLTFSRIPSSPDQSEEASIIDNSAFNETAAATELEYVAVLSAN